MAENRTAREIIRDALITLGILDPNESPTATDLQTAFGLLNGMISSWATERLTIPATIRHVFPLVSLQAEYTIGPGGDFDVPRPTWIPYAGLILNNQTPAIEVPLEAVTVKDWSLVGIKDLQSTQPTNLYYNHASPQTGPQAGMGICRFWPVPQIAYDIALYLPQALVQFADYSTTYVFSDGVAIAIQYNLAKLLARPCGGFPPPEDIKDEARKFKANIKRANIRLTDLSIDPALRPKPGALYNWRNDTLR